MCDLGNGWSIKANALSNIACFTTPDFLYIQYFKARMRANSNDRVDVATIHPPRIGGARSSGSRAQAASFSDIGAFCVVYAHYPGGDNPASLMLINKSSTTMTSDNEITCNLLVDCCEFGEIV